MNVVVIVGMDIVIVVAGNAPNLETSMKRYSVWRTSNIDGSPFEADYMSKLDINEAHRRMEDYYQEDKVNSYKRINKSTYEVREAK